MKTLILYKSKTGSTKKYAEWLQDEFPKFDLSSSSRFKMNKLAKYQRVLLFSWTEGGYIKIRPFLEKNWDKLKRKSVYLIAVGVFPENSWMSKMAFNQIPENIRKKFDFYCKLPGITPGISSEKSLNFAESFGLKLFGGRIQDEPRIEDLDQVISQLKKTA